MGRLTSRISPIRWFVDRREGGSKLVRLELRREAGVGLLEPWA